jgi:hypothetical protein
MLLYSIILFLAAIPMLKISISIYKGKTDLIHDYHQTKVTDKAAYGRAFGRAMFVVSAALLLSGIVGLFGFSDRMATIAVATLFVGLFIGIAMIIAVQIKYNRGLF